MTSVNYLSGTFTLAQQWKTDLFIPTKVKPTEKYLTPHHIFGEQTFDDYCRSWIPEIQLKDKVSTDVKEAFEVIESLLALSYFQNQFVDVAMAKALYTFEMAMRIRFKDEFPPNKAIYFNDLINKIAELQLLKVDLLFLKEVKWMRNHYAHPKRHTFSDFAAVNAIAGISYLIKEVKT